LKELLQRVRETAVQAYSHPSVPLERLLHELKPERDPSHGRLFQVVFVLQNTPPTKWRLAGLEVQQEEVDLGTAKFDLMMHLEPGRQEGLQGTVSYRKNFLQD